MGKIIGSMQPSIYLFEPSLPKMMDVYEFDISGVLFEDYVIPAYMGRGVNIREHEDSYWGNYISQETMQERLKIKWRDEAVERILQDRPWIIVKLTEYAGRAGWLPGGRFVSIVRNGNDVVNSAARLGWYLDGWLERSFLDTIDEPQGWYNWNLYTRMAWVWRTQSGNNAALRYEDLVSRPEVAVGYAIKHFNLQPTELTAKHVESVKQHKQRSYPSIVSQIEEPERTRFLNRMEELGYAV